MTRLRFGVLGAAKIAMVKVIPAMQRSERTEVVAIGSRDVERIRNAARALGVHCAYQSYDSVLADENVDAVYIPLPNHLHLEWTRRAAEAGKHVLCEKPIGLNESEAQEMIAIRDRTGVIIQEAFMVRTHPQWTTVVDMVRSGALGELRAMTGVFSYFNDDPSNIRNVAAYGGGALMDIGCYFVMTSRMVFGREPERVFATMDMDPRFGTDRLTTMVLDYGRGATFGGTCGTQMAPCQRIQILGTRGHVEIEIPVNAIPNEPAWLTVEGVPSIAGGARERIHTVACDQYTVQGDRFADAVQGGGPQPYPLEESLGNMRVIDALFQSARLGGWIDMRAEVKR
jgi:predicted dehydrogenase